MIAVWTEPGVKVRASQQQQLLPPTSASFANLHKRFGQAFGRLIGVIYGVGERTLVWPKTPSFSLVLLPRPRLHFADDTFLEPLWIVPARFCPTAAAACCQTCREEVVETRFPGDFADVAVKRSPVDRWCFWPSALSERLGKRLCCGKFHGTNRQQGVESWHLAPLWKPAKDKRFDCLGLPPMAAYSSPAASSPIPSPVLGEGLEYKSSARIPCIHTSKVYNSRLIIRGHGHWSKQIWVSRLSFFSGPPARRQSFSSSIWYQHCLSNEPLYGRTNQETDRPFPSPHPRSHGLVA